MPIATPPDVEPVVVPESVDAAISLDAAPTPSPPLWELTIIAINVDGPGSMLTLSGGAKTGVRKGWRAYVVDADGLAAPCGGLELIAVHDSSSIARSELSPDHVKAYTRVRVEPR